jgi:DNA helicase HerA-like ATPase
MPTTQLNLGGIQLPPEAITETFVILGKRGSGKTTTARVLAEELLHINLPVVIVDPTGVWWGLRSSADLRRGHR